MTDARPPITRKELDRLEAWCRSVDADLLADGPTCIWEDLIAALRAADRMATELEVMLRLDGRGYAMPTQPAHDTVAAYRALVEPLI